MTTKEVFEKVPLFSDLTGNELEALSKASTYKKYDKDEIIIHKQDEGDSFFSIVSGRVKVVLADDEGKEFIVGILQSQEFFGELSLIDGEPRSATVVAIEPTEVVTLGREDFIKQFTSHPDIAIKVLRVLGRRLRNANESMESLVFLDVCGRLARILLDMAREDGISSAEGIEIKVTHKRTELASLVGTTRETLTRALKTLEIMGYINIKKNSFIIKSADGLKSRVY